MGTAVAATGAETCTTCGVGTFSDVTGASACTRCVAFHGRGYTSLVGEASCERAEPGYFWVKDKPLACPDGAICEEPGGTTPFTIELEAGYSRLGELATVVYKWCVPCPSLLRLSLHSS